MSEETANDLLHFASHHVQDNGLIWFFGAEPFCGFKIMEYIVEKAVSTPLPLKFGCTTNCTLIDEEKAKWMGKHKFGILCSLDLSKERHDKYRVYPDGRGSWDDAWRGLQLVRKYVNPTPQVRATFGPGTIVGLADDIKFMIEEGLTNLAVGAVYEADWKEADFNELRVEFEILREYYADWYEQGLPVFSMFVRDGIAPALRGDQRGWENHCGLGQGSLGIDVNGDIYPCHRFVASKEAHIGNVSHGFSPNRLRWMQDWGKMPPYAQTPTRCLDCSYKPACSGGCIAANYDQFGNTHVLSDNFCTLKQLEVEYFSDFLERFRDNKIFQQIFLSKQRIKTRE